MKKLFRIKEMGRGAIISGNGGYIVQTNTGIMMPLPEYAFGIVMARKIRTRLHALGVKTIMIECVAIRTLDIVTQLQKHIKERNNDAGYIHHLQDNLQDLYFEEEMKQDA